MKIVNPKWADQQQRNLDSGGGVDETLSANIAAQWLIAKLSHLNRPFRVFNLGAGVKRITTNTDRCPCCKKPL